MNYPAAIAAKRAELAQTPAWPMFPVATPAPVPFDSMHCSADNRVRVAKQGAAFFVSIDGDNFCGPFKTAERAQAYGEAAITLTRAAVKADPRRFTGAPLTGFGAFAS